MTFLLCAFFGYAKENANYSFSAHNGGGKTVLVLLEVRAFGKFKNVPDECFPSRMKVTESQDQS